jgi:hypothetical protein
MRIAAALALVVAVVAASACGGGAGRKVTQDEVASCLKETGQFPVVQQGDKGQIRYAGSQGGVQAMYGATNRVQVNVLIGDDSGESSNLSDNMKASGAWVDVTREHNAVYAIPSKYEDSPNRTAAGDATKACL